MLITTTEGTGWRYEVLAASEGFTVQARDLDTGVVADEDTRVFRTVFAAFAYADLSAAADQCAAAVVADEDDQGLALAFEAQMERFRAVRQRFDDDGIQPGACLIGTRASGWLH